MKSNKNDLKLMDIFDYEIIIVVDRILNFILPSIPRQQRFRIPVLEGDSQTSDPYRFKSLHSCFAMPISSRA